jgi:hypothetical protein
VSLEKWQNIHFIHQISLPFDAILPENLSLGMTV